MLTGPEALLRLAIRVQRAEAELVLAELLELAPSGVEEVALGDDTIEYAVYGAPGELPTLPDVKAAAGAALVEVSTAEIADDWAERWREFHRPLVLQGKVTVRPPWEPRGDTPIDVVIDPGQAFGTGAHATTRLCLELMLKLEPRGALLDLGCGSGVLAIAAAALGFSPVIALDNDPESVRAADANARANGVEVEIRRHDLRHGAVVTAATVTANLLAPLLLDWARRLQDAREVPDRLIASGLLTHEADPVAEAFSGCGLTEAARVSRGGWAALLLARTDRSARVDNPGRPNSGHPAGDAGPGRGHPSPSSEPGTLQGGESSCPTRSRSA